MVEVTVIGATGHSGNPQELIDILVDYHDGEVVAVDAAMVCGRDHLVSAAEHAARAFKRGTNVSSTLTIETLLYASGEDQIYKALEKMGPKDGSGGLGLVLFDVHDPEGLLSHLGLRRDDDLLAPDEGKLRRFGITEEELDAVPREDGADLVLEKVAFVEMLKR